VALGTFQKGARETKNGVNPSREKGRSNEKRIGTNACGQRENGRAPEAERSKSRHPLILRTVKGGERPKKEAWRKTKTK